MIRIPKGMMAEFSFFLEEHFNITSIIWTILFMAVCFAIVSMWVIYIAKYIVAKKTQKKFSIYPVYTGVTMVSFFIMNHLVATAYTWDSKLQRVMENFNYVLTFPANRNLFFSALEIPNNTANQKNIFDIALYLNDAQWNKVIDTADGGGWYFGKVYKAITEILRLGESHMSLDIIYQNYWTFIPVILIVLFGTILIIRKKRLSGILVIISGLLCIIGNLGAGIFVLTMLLAGFGLEIIFRHYEKKILER